MNKIWLLTLLSGSLLTNLLACGDKTVEVCDDGIDNDDNGFLDCNDESCSSDALCLDQDSDGFIGQDDCDDTDPTAYPEADELCDSVDNNCNGDIDEEPLDGEIFYVDADIDGYGDLTQIVKACEIVEGLADNASDCDDENAEINPGMDEVCDSIDNNCDNIVDSDAVDLQTYYRDNDSDGYGMDNATQEACSLPDGFSTEGGDCDDTDATAYPSNTEVCDNIDNDCDGQVDINVIDGSTFYADTDQDGYGDAQNTLVTCVQPDGYVTDNTDCDDSSSLVNPNQSEVCDTLDNDCNGLADDDDSNLIIASTTHWYIDTDGDGQGDEDATSTRTCVAPVDSLGNPYVDNRTDCDDSSVFIYLGAPETCNGTDDDCDGVADDKPTDADVYYIDVDGDGYGDDSLPIVSCTDPSTSSVAYVMVGGDCNDNDASFNPGVVDTCDGFDQNCSGDESDASGTIAYYADLDGDGFGNANSMVSACEAPANHVLDNTDCNDQHANSHPGATEVCDLLDNDCNGFVDQADANFDTALLNTYYADQDQDGYGDVSASVQDCVQPVGYVENNDDCNDSRLDVDNDGVADGFFVNPSEVEVWYDGVDADCDGMDDFDQDGDGDLPEELDCDGDGTLETSCDLDGDGVMDYVAGTDCDDNNASMSGIDLDGDGYSACQDDCNEDITLDSNGVMIGFYTYPGAGHNEDDPTQCITDMDGDGYGGVATVGCLDFWLFDTYGDGWNGNRLDVYENGVLTGSLANQNLDGISYNSGTGEGYFETFCANMDTTELSLVFIDGSFNSEVEFEIFDAAGNSLATGQGSGTYDLIVSGVTYTNGDTVFVYGAPSGTDCDDTDSNIIATDADNDGAIDCMTDCDPTDASLNMDDLDGDGYSTCEGDCDDDANDADGDGVADGALRSPGLTETWYNGVDSNCDGLSDYDQDGDGEDSDQHGGTDCNDVDADVYAGALEICDGIDNNCDGLVDDQDPNVDSASLSAFYEDIDGDGYGTDATMVLACAPPPSYSPEGGDCNDDPNTGGNAQNPGITEIWYDGVDSDCDGLSDFDQDGDGDLPAELDCDGDGVPETSCDIDNDGVMDYVAGTDCDDSSSASNNLDLDGDGITSCAGDCNESTELDGNGVMIGSYTYPGAAYLETDQTACLTDMDGDGYGGVSPIGCLDFWLFDTYGDSWNGNRLDIYEDGVLTGSLANQNLDGVSYNGGSGEGYFETFCAQGSTQQMNVVFVDGSFNSEVQFEIFDAAGNSLGAGQGSGTTSVIFDGVTYTNGDTIATFEGSAGNDCDDNDPNIALEDNDGDGVSACSLDCDDNNALVNGLLAEDCFDGIDNDCDGSADCDDADCASACFELDCADGIDGDNDGAIDCADSDCVDEAICIESICDDGTDNDGDGATDCADSDCADDNYCQTNCVDPANDIGSMVGVAVATGTNIGMLDTTDGYCTQGTGGEDVTFLWTAPFSGTFTFDTSASNYDTVLYIQENCLTEQFECNDDADFANGVYSARLSDVYVGAGESIVITIDAYDSYEQGDYVLDILLTSEMDCSNGSDDDNDGDIDCADADCAASSACGASACPNFDLGFATGTGLLSGDLLSASTDNFQASCSSSGTNDYVAMWQAPSTGCATFSTLNGSMDTILALFDACPSAGGAELTCNDDYDSFNFIYTSEMSYDVVAGSVYYVGIDAWSYDISSTYILDITVQSNTSCN